MLESELSKKYPIIGVEPAEDMELDYFDDDELEDDELLNFKSFMRSRIFLDEHRTFLENGLKEY